MKTDIIIIGSGAGGYETAVYAAKNGLSVTIIEANKLGGTCLNEGCIPTKALCRNAVILEDLKHAEEFGISDLSFRFDIRKAIERKNEVVSALVNGVEFLLRNKLINYVEGKAVLKDANTVQVGTDEYTADHIIIATGSVSKMLPVEGRDLPNVLTSKEMLDIDYVPEKLCVIGAGVIGLEFASIFNAFGSEVTVLEYTKEVLPNFDTDLTKRFKQVFVKKGIEIVNQAEVNGINRSEDTLIVNYELKGETKQCIADVVLMAVGRAPNVDSLNLADIGIDYCSKGIRVSDNMQTNIPSVYAIGDITGECLLAHAATFQGIKALNHIMGKEDNIRLDIIPSAVFTFPEVAVVGLTENQCKEQGISYKSKKSFYRANGKAVSMGEPDGFCKIIADDKGRLLGCHIFGAHSADIIHEISALINKQATVYECKDMIHAHPTLSEVIQDCIREF